MVNVNGIQPPFMPGEIQPTDIARSADRPAPPPAPAGDVVEISTAARLAAKIHDLPEIRQELVQRVREEIAAGTYETEERIEGTITRLMDELFGDS